MACSVVAGRVLDEINVLLAVGDNFLLPVARNALRKLEQEISTVEGLLVDAEKKATSDADVRAWLIKLEDVLHAAEDLAGELHAETLRRSVMFWSGITRKVRNVVFSMSPSQLVFSHKIRKIRQELDQVFEVGNRFTLQRQIAGNSSILTRSHDSHLSIIPQEEVIGKEEEEVIGREEEEVIGREEEEVIIDSHLSIIPQEEVIGREEEKKKIVKWLLDHDEGDLVVSVLPIVGMGGMGKTILAKFVYDDERVQNSFELKLWCFVGVEDLDIKQIMETLLSQISDYCPQNLDVNLLMNLFRERIYGKRFLLVLDDLCSEDREKWRMLMGLFMSSVASRGSRVIVTTRSENVAQITGTVDRCFLGPLDEEAAWSFFKLVAFKEAPEPRDSRITEIARKIVRQCGGNPLALRTIGIMLYNRNPEEWYSFLSDAAARFGALRSESDGILKTLKLGYDFLPSHLKNCFAYCGLFPKDYEFDVQTLVRFWISQGFIWSSNDGSDRDDLERMGYNCFLDLLKRSFFQEPKKDELGNVTKCQMHSLMRDLAISVAEPRFTTYELKTEGTKCDMETQHVSFGFHLDAPWQIPSDLIEAKRIRTIILTRQSQWDTKGRSSHSICDVIASKFKFLRTLDLHNSGIKVVPDSIGDLKFLKYLDLSRNKDIKALPMSFCRLQNLHTLKLNGCGRLQELPRKIRKLINLRHLEVDSCYSLTHMPQGLGQLTNLETLSEFVLSRGNSSASRRAGELDELAKLNDLTGQLRIKNLRPGTDASRVRLNRGEGTDMSAEVLKQKARLRSVMLIWDTATTTDNDASIMASDYKISLDRLEPHPNLEEISICAYGGIMFSDWLSSHENLVKISLSKCMNCIHLPWLSGLTGLKVLVLEEMANLEFISENIGSPSPVVYTSLEELRLTNLPNLNRWWRVTNGDEETTFLHLSKLIIEDCPNLKSMPLFPHLEELLLLKNTTWEPFQDTISRQQILSQKAAAEASSSLSSLPSSESLNLDHPLSKLRTLCLIQMSNVDTGMWQYLQSLRSLTLDHLPNVNTLLESLSHVISLQELHISRCDSLSAITPWISDLKSLRKLSIRLCPSLTIPLDQIGLISSLQNVEIEDCPKIVHLENLLKDRILRR